MAQGDQRPRHSRLPSRILRLGDSTNDDRHYHKTTEKQRQDDEATIRYIKRTLCAQPSRPGPPKDTAVDARPLHQLLPPLTSSNAVDVQLYAIIAVIVNQFVQSWYDRITPDQQFVSEIVQIVAHCTRGIEQRCRDVDLEELLLDELPALLLAHVDALTTAQEACSTDRPPSDVQMIYHSINPKTALTPLPDNPTAVLEQQRNEIAWSQLLVSRILPLVLPPEDLQNPCLYVFVSEVFSEVIVHNAICGKASESWVLWNGVTKLIYALRPDRIPQHLTGTTMLIDTLEQSALLSSAPGSKFDDRLKSPRLLDLISRNFWSLLQLASVVWMLLRWLAVSLMHASSIPARSTRGLRVQTSNKLPVTAVGPDSRPNAQGGASQGREQRPVIRMRVWTCASRLILMEQRMPWLSGFLSLLQWLALHGPGKLCSTNSALDRLLSSQITARLLNPALLPRFLLAIRSALFPNNALAPTRQTPTDAEIAEMKRKCAMAIVDLIPMPITSRYFATKDQDLLRRDVERSLDLFADSYINKHLIIGAVELIVVRLFPEFGEPGAQD